MITDPAKVMERSLEDSCGLTAYAKTLMLRETNVSTDRDYQRNYTSYYRVRRDAEWLKQYYTYMEENKNNRDIEFADILRRLSNIPHKVRKTKSGSDRATSIEASFASKMLATINENYPIWDSQVVRAVGLEIDAKLQGEARIQAYIHAYEELTSKIKTFIDTPEGQECIRIFDERFPRYTYINPMKKIDHYLWNVGK